MTPEGAAEPPAGGEWDRFVARAVDEMREEFGDEAAHRVAALLEAVVAEADGHVEAAESRLADAWADLRRHESELATRRAELVRIEDVIGERLAEAESRLIDAENARAAATADREEAAKVLDEARSGDPVVELRETGEARRALDQRDLELREWEAELVRRSQEIDLRDEAIRRRDAARRYLDDRSDPSRPSPGWGRRRRRD